MFVGRRLAFALLLIIVPVAAGASQSAGVTADFVYDTAPFLSAHASTLVETTDGLVTAWFGGTSEGNPDVGIWLSRYQGAGWLKPTEVATGVQNDGSRHPCWNPVLFQPSNGPLLLFYKVGPSPREWWGMVRTSTDNGRTWSGPIRLPDGVLGPIRAKPVELRSGTLLAGSSTEHDGWFVQMELFHTDARTDGDWRRDLSSSDAWSLVGPLNDSYEYEAIQPTVLVHSASKLQILCRTRQGVITEVWSHDGGLTWGSMLPTDLPNPNAGIDALRLVDGRFLLVYNPVARGRNRLVVAISDDGHVWRRGLVLENAADGEYSYPAMVQSLDGLIHVTYTWKRQRIKHVVFDPSESVG